MTDCTQVPTLDEIYQAKKNITDLDTFTNSTADTFVDSDGVTKATLTGMINAIEIAGELAVLSVGWDPIGEFSTGFTYAKLNDVGRDALGSWWRYNGSDLPKVITAGTVPSSPNFSVISFETADNVQWKVGKSVGYSLDDNEGFKQALLAESGKFDNGLPDTAIASQRLDALKVVATESSASGKLGIPSQNTFQLMNLEYGGLTLNGEKSVSLLGDSISFGQGSGDVYNNSYVGILTKMLNIEYGGSNIGFLPLIQASDTQIHTVAATGSWGGNSGANASHTMNGYGRYSTSGTAQLNVAVPAKLTPKFDIWYTRQPSGGSFGVYVNGSLKSTVSTVGGTSKSGWFRASGFNMADSGSGNCLISLRPVGDGEVEIVGISYGNGDNSYRLQNWSQPGRKAQHLSTSVIDNAVKGARSLIFALGHNDQNSTGSDLTAALANMEYVKTSCQANGTKLIVIDLIWDKSYSNAVKAKLKEIGESDGATYIEFSNWLNINGTLPTASQLISQGFLVDTSHPSPDGHRTIAEAVAKSLALSTSSKGAAELMTDTLSEVIIFTPAITNATITASKAFYVKEADRVTLTFRARVTSAGASDIILTIPPEAAPNVNYYTGAGVEGQLIPCGLVIVGGTGITPSLGQFTSATTFRFRGSASIADNSDIHASITYVHS